MNACAPDRGVDEHASCQPAPAVPCADDDRTKEILMRLSPPFCTSVILVASLVIIPVVTGRKAPRSQVSISVSSSTYATLMTWSRTQDHRSGPMTADRAIDLLLALQGEDTNTDDIYLRETNYSPAIR
jgi:hypothetical protein